MLDLGDFVRTEKISTYTPYGDFYVGRIFPYGDFYV